MRWLAGMLGIALGLLAASGARADVAEAPLSDSKKALQELRKEQSTQGVQSADGKLRDLMPEIAEPGARTVAPAETYGPPKKTTPTAKDRQANWLLSGMDRLDKKHAKDDRTRSKDPLVKDTDDQEPAEGAEDLLGLYTQKEKRDAVKTDSSEIKDTLVDPAAQLMRNWLADSPLRGKLLEAADLTVRNPNQPSGAINSPAVPASALGLADMAGANSRNDPLAPASAANPYLQGMEFPAGGPSPGSPEPSLPEIKPQPAQPSSVTVQPVMPTMVKPAPPPAADDQKYFPQLKKF